MDLPPSLWLSRTAFYLTSGSALLLFGAVAFARGSFLGCFLFVAAWFGAILHALGWFHLYAAGSLDPGGRATHAAGAVVFAFLAGIVAMAIAVPTGWELLFFALPYVPFVFGPIVLVHARLFLSFPGELRGNWEPRVVRVGCFILVALAALGVAGQLGHLAIGLDAMSNPTVTFWTFFPYPAGLTALGYALVWWGWSGAAARARREAPPPPPAPPPAQRPE